MRLRDTVKITLFLIGLLPTPLTPLASETEETGHPASYSPGTDEDDYGRFEVEVTRVPNPAASLDDLVLQVSIRYTGSCPRVDGYGSRADEIGVVVEPVPGSGEDLPEPGKLELERRKQESIRERKTSGGHLLFWDLERSVPKGWYAAVYFPETVDEENLRAFMIRRDEEALSRVSPEAMPIMSHAYEKSGFAFNMDRLRFHGGQSCREVRLGDYWKLPASGSWNVSVYLMTYPDSNYMNLFSTGNLKVHRIVSNPILISDGRVHFPEEPSEAATPSADDPSVPGTSP